MRNYLDIYYKGNEKILDFRINQVLMDLLLLTLSVPLACMMYILVECYRDHHITYIYGGILLLTIVPRIIKIIFKVILTFTVGFFISIEQILDNFMIGFIFLIVGLLLFGVYLSISMFTILIISLIAFFIGCCLLITY